MQLPAHLENYGRPKRGKCKYNFYNIIPIPVTTIANHIKSYMMSLNPNWMSSNWIVNKCSDRSV